MESKYTGWVHPPLHMRPDALDRILRSELSEPAMRHAAELVTLGYTVIRGAFTFEHCRSVIGEFDRFYRQNSNKFNAYRSNREILPRFTNLHQALPIFTQMFTRNKLLLEV